MFTGERVIPGQKNLRYTFLRHLVVYQVILKKVSGLRVLDCGCGEGYGSNLLASSGKEVVGLDRLQTTIQRAKEKYPLANLKFLAADLEATLPLSDQMFDAVVCLQTIEHLKKPDLFLTEIKRVLKPGGTVFISTPNIRTFSPTGDLLDPYHYYEYNTKELYELLCSVFSSVKIYQLTGNDKVMKFLARDMQMIQRLVRLDFLRMRRWMPKLLRRFAYLLALNLFRRSEKIADGSTPLTLEDFILTPDNINERKVLDLVAVCSNSEPVALDS